MEVALVKTVGESLGGRTYSVDNDLSTKLEVALVKTIGESLGGQTYSVDNDLSTKLEVALVKTVGGSLGGRTYSIDNDLSTQLELALVWMWTRSLCIIFWTEVSLFFFFLGREISVFCFLWWTRRLNPFSFFC